MPDLLKHVDVALVLVPNADHEILCVHDRSTIRPRERFLAARERHPRLRIISLSRNLGHQAALSTALESATVTRFS